MKLYDMDNKVVFEAPVHTEWELVKAALEAKVDFRYIDLEGYDLFGIKFQDVDFTGANLISSNCTDCTFNGCTFNGAELDHVNLTDAPFYACKFEKCNMSYSNATFTAFRNCYFDSPYWAYALIRQAYFERCTIYAARVYETAIIRTEFKDCRILNTSWKGAVQHLNCFTEEVQYDYL